MQSYCQGVCVRVCVRYGGCATAAMRQGEWRGNIPYREREGERGGEQGGVRQSKEERERGCVCGYTHVHVSKLRANSTPAPTFIHLSLFRSSLPLPRIVCVQVSVRFAF